MSVVLRFSLNSATCHVCTDRPAPSTRAATPVREKLAEFLSFVRKDFKFDGCAIDLHVGADSAEKFFRHSRCPVLSVGKVLGAGRYDLCWSKRSGGSHHFATTCVQSPKTHASVTWIFRPPQRSCCYGAPPTEIPRCSNALMRSFSAGTAATWRSGVTSTTASVQPSLVWRRGSCSRCF